MKTSLLVFLGAAILTISQTPLRADAGYSFSFKAEQKHSGGTVKANDYETVKNQKWSYFITMDNKSFKDVADIQIKYVMFTKQGTFNDNMLVVRGQGDVQRHAGTVNIKMLRNNDTVTFSTDGVMLTKVDYYDGWYADEQAKGALKGLWLRVYVGGQMVAEFMDPQGLSNKVTFDPPPKQ